jgi:NDP-sugar pyrophosphorylase family protein
MKAMILAAGLGTRLRPLTDDRPKALVEVAGRTLLEVTLSRLRSFGVADVIVNVHHFADKVVDYLKANRDFGMRVEISREDVLLDTGGALKQAAWFFLDQPGATDEPFILHNVDVLTTIDLQRLVDSHVKGHALATLAVQQREASRYLLFNEQLQLCGRRRTRDDKPEMVRPCRHPRELAFSGIHVLSPRILRTWKEEGVFSIIDAYLRLVGGGERILAFRADEWYWRDLGKPESVTQAEQDLKHNLGRTRNAGF